MRVKDATENYNEIVIKREGVSPVELP